MNVPPGERSRRKNSRSFQEVYVALAGEDSASLKKVTLVSLWADAFVCMRVCRFEELARMAILLPAFHDAKSPNALPTNR